MTAHFCHFWNRSSKWYCNHIDWFL